ncbi:MAG: Xaa-Pro peptidase family protein [Candidatus Eisenbacteria bacterium]
MSRLDNLYKDLKARQIDKFLVSNISSVRYLSGFSGSTAAMLVGPDGATLVTDFRYREQAEDEVYGGIRVEIDTRDALAAITGMLSDFEGRLGFESASITYAIFEKIRDNLKASLVPVEASVELLRQVKDESELASIAKAVDISDEVFAEVVGEIKPGMTEVDIAARIDFLLRKKSSRTPAFETIVASGEHSSLPHAQPTTRVIRKGDLVKMDFGAVWDGYCADITRTVVLGKASKRVHEIYDIVLAANEKAISGVRAGVKGSDVDGIARGYITEKGYGEEFGHGLGHGVGLDIHEGPRFSRKDDTVLRSGMVATVEPGIYIPGWGGVRIEDIVVVEDDGCRVLTSSEKTLMEVGT